MYVSQSWGLALFAFGTDILPITQNVQRFCVSFCAAACGFKSTCIF